MSSPNIIYFKGKSWNLSKAYYTINNITYQVLNGVDIIREGDELLKECDILIREKKIR